MGDPKRGVLKSMAIHKAQLSLVLKMRSKKPTEMTMPHVYRLALLFIFLVF